MIDLTKPENIHLQPVDLSTGEPVTHCVKFSETKIECLVMHQSGMRFEEDSIILSGNFKLVSVIGNQPAKPDLSSLHKTREGIPAIILGGAPSVVADLERLPQSIKDEAKYFSVNWHAITALKNLDISYLVFSDDPNYYAGHHLSDNFKKHLSAFEGVKLSCNHLWSDYNMDVQLPASVYRSSVVLAAWLALYMGHSVIVTGCECFQGGAAHCDDPEGFIPEEMDRPFNLEWHLGLWKAMLCAVNNPEICAASGPLVSVLGEC